MSGQRFTSENTVLLMLDYQVGVMSWVQSISQYEMKLNALKLAKSARTLCLPIVLSTSMEESEPGPLIEELAITLPGEFSNRIPRWGAVRSMNAMSTEGVREAVSKTGRRKILLAGAALDMSIEFTVHGLVVEGYDVQVVVDAGGWSSRAKNLLALGRMQEYGAQLVSTKRAIAGLLGMRAI